MAKQKTFEEAIERLEEIIGLLEAGQAPLDDSLKYFEEGIGLVKLCTAKLDKAEQKITILTKQEDGEYHEQDFSETEE